ncbi:hypothetical protein [Bacillus sp. 03113]|uniref:hypothetical protein n=1 Tax=Bacillus sp. 03113 TaxID=2578211 RepID=UPI001144E09D|nr:hypothetical protein [Bacillus sp. 03113]
MDEWLTLIISIIEWIALISFPIIMLGYIYNKYIRKIVLIAVCMGIISFGLHLVALPLYVIITIQMLILFYSIKLLLRMNNLESLVISSMGYGFYILVQLIILEFVRSVSMYDYFQLLHLNIKYMIQVTSIVLVGGICLLLSIKHFHLELFRHQLRIQNMNNKIKAIIVANTVLIFTFICLAAFEMQIEHVNNKYTLVLICIVTLFIILAIFILLHSQLQMKEVIEAKKYYLDQEQQVATVVEKLKEEYGIHFKAILRLCNVDSIELCREYVEKHQLNSSKIMTSNDNLKNLDQIDELLYAVLLNKRKLSNLLGVKISISSQMEIAVTTTLWQNRYISSILDDIIFSLYHHPRMEEKVINVLIQAEENEIAFHITSNLRLSENEYSNLKILDFLLKFKENKAIVQADFEPVRLSIKCPIS